MTGETKNGLVNYLHWLASTGVEASTMTQALYEHINGAYDDRSLGDSFFSRRVSAAMKHLSLAKRELIDAESIESAEDKKEYEKLTFEVVVEKGALNLDDVANKLSPVVNPIVYPGVVNVDHCVDKWEPPEDWEPGDG